MIIRRTSTILLMLLIAAPFSALAIDVTKSITSLLLNHPYPFNQDRQKGEPTLTAYPNNPSDHARMMQDVQLSIEAIEAIFANNTDLKNSHVVNSTFYLMFDAYLGRLKNVQDMLEIKQKDLVDTPGQHNGPKRRPHQIKIDALKSLQLTLRELGIVYPERETQLVDTFMKGIASAIETYNQNIPATDKFCDLDQEAQTKIFANNHSRVQTDRLDTLLSLLSAHPDFVLPSEEQIKAAFSEEEAYDYYQSIRHFIDQTGSRNNDTLGMLKQPVDALVAAQMMSKKLDPQTSREIFADYLHLDEKHTESLKVALKKS